MKAHALFKNDIDYVVKDNGEGPEIIIVDEFTGRLMFGRRYSEGLHQAKEAKERGTDQRAATPGGATPAHTSARAHAQRARAARAAGAERGGGRSGHGLDRVRPPQHAP